MLITWGPWVVWFLFWFVLWLLWLVWLGLRRLECVRWLLWMCLGWVETEGGMMVEGPKVHGVWRVAAWFFGFAENGSAVFSRGMREAKNWCLGRRGRG